MVYTNSGAREDRKAAAAKVSELSSLLVGRSGLSKAEKVANLRKAAGLSDDISDLLYDAADKANSVTETAKASAATSTGGSNSEIAAALALIGKALGVS